MAEGSGPTVSVVAVVFGAELPLLALQARSIARFCADLPLAEILLIVNEAAPAATLAEIAALRPAFGARAEILCTATGDDLFTWDNTDGHPLPGLRKRRTLTPALRLARPGGGWARTDGWQMQQALKLASARGTRGDYTLLLDAKNVFLRPVTLADLIAADGRPRARLTAPKALHRQWQGASQRIIGGQVPPEAAETSLRFVTPFVIRRRLLAEVLDHVETRAGPVQTLFAKRGNKATEFMLIDAYCKARLGGPAAVFAEGLMRSYTVFKGMAPDLAQKILAEAAAAPAECLGLHRGALQAFSHAHWEILDNLLLGAELFPDAAALAAWRASLDRP